jgi:hypothetical protein
MRDDTPYRDRPATERAHEVRCMRALLGHAPRVDFIWEAFGGLGETGSVLRELQPWASVQASELDLDCAEAYNARHGAGLSGGNLPCLHTDAMSYFQQHIGPKPNAEPWAASLDFNRLTIMDLRGRPSGRWKVELLAAVLDRRPRWAQVTDSAVRYLHLNWQRYGLRRPRPDSYARAVSREVEKRWGYVITHHEHYHAASYYLLEPVR